MGSPLSRSTKAAASRALSFLADVDFAGTEAADLADGFLFAAGAGFEGARFFLAGMQSLLGRTLAGRQHPLRRRTGQEHYLDRAVTSRQFSTESKTFSGD